VQDVVDERQANTLHVNVDFHLHALQLTRLHAQQLHAIKQTDTNIHLVTYFFPGQSGNACAILYFNKATNDGVLGWQWHWPNHMQRICTSLHRDNHLNLITQLNGPDALQDAELNT